MIEKLVLKGVDEDKTLLFENWVETDKIYPLSDMPQLLAELNLPKDRVIILYSGNMGQKQGLEIIVQAAEKFSSRNDIFFVLCGEGSSKGKLMVQAQGLENIIWVFI